jgi:hypothetical protein
VLVLPGPAPVPEAVVVATLDRALAAEEQALEERAVLAALATAAGPADQRPRVGARQASRHDHVRRSGPLVPIEG